jgi:hypothetical protein
MKKVKFMALGLAAILVATSAFKPFAGELYWFTAGTQTYVNQFKTIADEEARLHAIDGHTYNTTASGGTAKEDGADPSQLNVSGQPSQGYSGAPSATIYRH